MSGNYAQSLFNQLEEALLKIDLLVEENKALKKRIAAVEEERRKEISVLNAKIVNLEKENQKLKDAINKDSHNSSKPPSSDGFKKIHNNTRRQTGRPVGGQKGHKGKTPVLYKNPGQIINHKKEFCECGGHVKYIEAYKAKQKIDVNISTNIEEHRVFVGQCEDCHKKVINKFPVGLMDIITYGDCLKSLSVLLSAEGVVSINRIRQMIRELTAGGIKLSEGTIAKWNGELAGRLDPVIVDIKKHLMVSPVLHKDETGIRVGKRTKWLHVLSNETHTLYHSHQKRGNDADKEMDILPSYSGVLVHDHIKGLYSFHCQHAECNAHILRYLKAVTENNKREWAEEMITFLYPPTTGRKKRKRSP